MIHKRYEIYTTGEQHFEKMCLSLMQQIDKPSEVLKMVFFGLPESNSEYFEQLQILRQCAALYFSEHLPVVSYVAQQPFIGSLSAEVVYFDSSPEVKITYGDNYIVLNNETCRELITGGILPPDHKAPFIQQTEAVFSIIEKLLETEKFSLNSIVRQWNYIQDITIIENNQQYYQVFNDARSHFYARTDWPRGFPAATGIGTRQGGVMIEVIAIDGDNLINQPLDNPLQISAHQYSGKVLHGDPDSNLEMLTTPKFERARVVGSNDRQIVYVSGTASIRGEESLMINDAVGQTQITMENIGRLIAPANYPFQEACFECKMLRIYVGKYELMPLIFNYMKLNYPEIKTVFVCADVCREELLVEIEGIIEVDVKNHNQCFVAQMNKILMKRAMREHQTQASDN